MSRAYPHPMKRNYNQQMGYQNQQLGSMSGIWDDFRESTLDPWVDKTLTSVGLDDKQIADIKADVGTSFDNELRNQQNDLINQITGGSSASTSPPIATQITNTIADIEKSVFVKLIPGGLSTILLGTIAGVGIAIYVTRK